MVSVCSSGWPGVFYVAQPDLKLVCSYPSPETLKCWYGRCGATTLTLKALAHSTGMFQQTGAYGKAL